MAAKRMTKIYAPNKAYNGTTAGVAFANGIGETNDKRLIKWFKDKGYSLKPFEDEAPKEVDAPNDVDTGAEGDEDSNPDEVGDAE